MDRCDVLLAGTMGDIGAMVAESLRAHGLAVMQMDFVQNTPRDEAGYRRTLLHAVEACRPRMIWPIGHPLALSRLVHGTDTDIAPRLTERLRGLLGDICVPVAKPDVIQLLDSKVDCSRLAGEQGIPQPVLYASAEEVKAFPVIFKRERSFGGSGVYKPESVEALRRLMANERGRRFLIEEFVEGEDVSVDMVRWGDEFHAACYRTLSRRQGQGPADSREPCEAPAIIAYGRRLVEAVGYEGVCGMDFRVGTDGRICFLECNPRFTGGVATQVAAGFDIPWRFYCLIENRASSESRDKLA